MSRTERAAANPNSSVNWSQFEPLVGIPAVDPNDVTPYAQHWMASVERQFGADTLATVSYVGTSSHHLLVLEEANPANPALCLSLGSACGPFNEQAARTAFGPQFGSVELQRTIANANYSALEADAEPSRAWTRSACQLYLFEVDRSIGGAAGAGEPRRSVVEPRPLGIRHAAQLGGELPLRNSDAQAREGLLHAVVEGWAVAGIARFTTGLPVTLLNNNDTSLLGTIPNGINNNGVDTPRMERQKPEPEPESAQRSGGV